MWGAVIAEHKRELIKQNAFLERNTSQINDRGFHLRKQEREKKTKTQSRRKNIIHIRVEITEMETKHSAENK